jgi:hypothetical protein
MGLVNAAPRGSALSPACSSAIASSLVKDELALARSRRRLGRLLAEALGVASPVVGDLEE